jgi:pimeloyl-ACP methyl ester carboxylesterase
MTARSSSSSSSVPLLSTDPDEDHPTHTTSFECGAAFRTSLIWHASIRTHCLVFPAAAGERPRQRLLVVVGNPGVCEFYYDFAQALHAQCDEKDEIVVVSHIGHCGQRVGDAFSLDDQVLHKRALLSALLDDADDAQRIKRELNVSTAPGLPIVLAGHSIGAYICFKLAAAEPRVRRVLALFPTFRNLREGLIPLIRVAVLPGVRQTFAALLGYLPNFVVSQLLHWSHGLSDETKYALSQNICYDFINNVLYMAYTETLQITTVDPEVDRLFAADRGRLHFFYSPIDNYTPLHFVDELKQQHPHLAECVHITKNTIRHAFVLSNSNDVATLLANSGCLELK